jgi:pimeloyl-ACP methyl ester carboxylesterase
MNEWTPPPTHQLSTPDGRVLRYCLYGAEDGRPVVYHSGTPGSRLAPPQLIELVDRCRVRLLAYDRPGYDGSTRLAGRSIAHAADDVAVLADAQDWDRFGTCGASGGGPHALACAVGWPDRVTRCAVMVCPAPYAADGVDGPAGLGRESWFAGMSPGEAAEATAALRGESVYRPLVERLGREVMANIEADEPDFLPGHDLAESDRAELTRVLAENSPGRRERARAIWIEGTDGWIDDMVAMVRPWGFDVARLGVPLRMWYGPEDVLCPPSHTEWLLAHLPGVQARELPGGHIVGEDSIAEMLDWVGDGGTSNR